VPIGRQFGIMMVVEAGDTFEVATFRGEEGYSDRRRPDKVFWTSAEGDAVRRDFTINALFYDPINNTVIDYVHGLVDLEAKLLKFVGQPQDRVDEDPLRMLRGVRLKNSLGFQYDGPSYRAISEQAHLIEHISSERILAELDRMWADPSRATSLTELAQVGLLKEILPEIANLRGLPQPLQYHKEGDVFDHTVRALASLPKHVPTFLVWAVLFHDAGKSTTITYPTGPGERIRYDHHKTVGAEMARAAGVRLTMSRTEIETVAWLVDHHMDLMGLETLREAKKRAYLLDPRFKWLLELHHADAAGTLPRDLSLYGEVKAFYQKYLALWKKEQKTGPPKALISGHDLNAELGVDEGPKMGQILEKIHEAQLERQITTKKDALALAKKLLGE
jgi:poly(A) polymerase